MIRRVRVEAVAGGTAAAAALAVVGGAYLTLADVHVVGLGVGELAEVRLEIAPTYDKWPFYVVGGVVVAILLLAAAAPLPSRSLRIGLLAAAWLWFTLAGTYVVAMHPEARSSSGGVWGPSNPQDYWGAETWSHIEPARDAAVARTRRSIGYVIDDGPARPVIWVAGGLGVLAIGVAASFAFLRRAGPRVALAAGVGAIPILIWMFAAVVEGFSHLE